MSKTKQTQRIEQTEQSQQVNILQVKRLNPDAKLPSVAHPKEDLGYDLFALENARIAPQQHTRVRTGIAAYQEGHGLLIRDRSSMADKGLFLVGGVIDAGYRGELVLVFATHRFDTYQIKAGDKIGQMIPLPVLTGEVVEVEELPESSRGEGGFGSSGQ